MAKIAVSGVHVIAAKLFDQSINQSINKTTYTKMTSGEQLK